ncbi:MAG: hypothetical protein QM809_13660 [Gordonia sp. (in: high G+C Gram-positive bacteria)]|uniref:hypothetical protein n=1 Tax=Gordonia sp. (in: high G+C Gram-positive bacteria) TaxID=84139 RepID=UPI0039E33A55
MAVFYLAALIPVFLTLVSGSRGAAWAALAVGGPVTLANVFDGLTHGIADGDVVPVITAFAGVGVPGALAIVATLAWARSPRAAATA